MADFNIIRTFIDNGKVKIWIQNDTGRFVRKTNNAGDLGLPKLSKTASPIPGSWVYEENYHEAIEIELTETSNNPNPIVVNSVYKVPVEGEKKQLDVIVFQETATGKDIKDIRHDSIEVEGGGGLGPD